MEAKKLRLNKRFYSQERIDSVRKTFSEAATINVQEKDDYFEISVETKKTGETEETILKEFANHCLVSE